MDTFIKMSTADLKEFAKVHGLTKFSEVCKQAGVPYAGAGKDFDAHILNQCNLVDSSHRCFRAIVYEHGCFKIIRTCFPERYIKEHIRPITTNHKKVIFLTDSELALKSQSIVDKFSKALNEAKSIAKDYNFDLNDSQSNILNAIFLCLKEKRDANSRENLEIELKKCLNILIKRGNYSTVSQLTSLFDEGKYDELQSKIKEISNIFC